MFCPYSGITQQDNSFRNLVVNNQLNACRFFSNVSNGELARTQILEIGDTFVNQDFFITIPNITNGINVGTGTGNIFQMLIGNTMFFRTLEQQQLINISTNLNTVDVNDCFQSSNVGVGFGLFKTRSTPCNLDFKTITDNIASGFEGITIQSTLNDVHIGSSITGFNLNPSIPTARGQWFTQKNIAAQLEFRTVTASTNMSITENPTDIIIASSVVGGSTITAGANVGTGTGLIFRDITAMTMNFRTLTAGTDMSITTIGDNVTLNATGASSVMLSNAGGIQSLVNDGTGPMLALKGLTAGSDISLTNDITNTFVTITNSSPASDITLTSAGGTISLVNDGVGPSLANKGLTAGSGITITNDIMNTFVTITNSSPASSVTLASAGGTISLVNDGSGPSLANKGLTAGTAIMLTDNGTDILIDNSDPASAISLTHAGTLGSVSIVNNGIPPMLANKGLIAGSGISLSSTSTDVTISTTSLSSFGRILNFSTPNMAALEFSSPLYCPFFDSTGLLSSTLLLNYQFKCPQNGTIGRAFMFQTRGFRVRVDDPTNGNRDIIITVLKNGIATSISCTLSANVFACDSTQTVAVVTGDLISIRLTLTGTSPYDTTQLSGALVYTPS